VDVIARKQRLKDELIAQQTSALAIARAAHAAAVEGATHAEATPENDKDTRGLEQSYLARGQAQRVEELAIAVAELETLALRRFGDDAAVAMSALVTVDEDGARRVYFIAPHGGGAALAGDVQVVTPRSPLGRALVGKRAGDASEVALPGKLRELEIIAVE
jgi:transcription elongation GreA/GreB family factor